MAEVNQSVFEKVKQIAKESGSQRKENLSQKIGKFFSNAKERINNFADIVFGTPEAAKFLGAEAAKFGNQKVEAAAQTIDESVNRVSESVYGTFERLVGRVEGVFQRLSDRVSEIKNNTQAKINRLISRAEAWGKSKIIYPIENRLQSIYELPADLRTWQADRERLTVFAADLKIQRETVKKDRKNNWNGTNIDKLNDHCQRVITPIEEKRQKAQTQAQEYLTQAQKRRETADQVFKRVYTQVNSLAAN